LSELQAAFGALHPGQLVVANLIILAATAVQASVGLGFALVAVPLLALVDLAFVPGPSLFVSLFLALAMTSVGRAAIDKIELLRIAAGVALGTAGGAVVLVFLRPENMAQLFGALILAAVAISLTGRQLPLTTANLIGAGTVSGIMGTLSGIHGPPLALVYQRSAPEKTRAMIAAIFLVAFAASLVALHLAGRFGWREAILGAALMPGLLLGYLLARRFLMFENPALFRTGVLLVAAVSAIALMFKG
jgi:hypothetical protein